MQKIKEISANIEEELDDSEKYIKYAIMYEHNDKTLSDLYYRLSLQERSHADLLHEEGVRLIEDYKAAGNNIPVAMQAVYDHLHEKHLDKATKIKMLQTQYHE